MKIEARACIKIATLNTPSRGAAERPHLSLELPKCHESRVAAVAREATTVHVSTTTGVSSSSRGHATPPDPCLTVVPATWGIRGDD
jgi:hypothetical protein